MNLERLTISLEDEQYEELVNEAERRGVSKSAVVRELFDRWHGDSPNSHNDFTSGEGVVNVGGEEVVKSGEDVVRRLEDLEERVAALEGEDGEEREAPSPRRRETDERTVEPVREGGEGEASEDEPAAADGDPYALIEAYDVPGLGEDTQEARRAALRAVVDELQDGPAKRHDYEERVFPDHGGGYDSFESWWTNLVHPFLKEALDAGAVDRYDDGEDRHQYYLPGNGPSSEGGVYDPTDEF